ncbi:replication/maintenance protein RepL [Providencia stuartii]|uniref:replication/maintenance protein RepL n=1 Tax=Providencia stuartii TaxID=588 RepID=UPI003D7FA0A7
MNIITNNQRVTRKIELGLEEATERREQKQKLKNGNFIQVYNRGWEKLLELAKVNSGAFELYVFFAQHIDENCGAVVCDQQLLSDQMGVSVRTIQRRISFLEKDGSLVKIPVSGKVYAYALNPHEIWKGFDNQKNYAAFVTKTLVNKDGVIKRKLKAMFSGKENNNDTYES